jgi:hypothetical protein
VRARRLARGHTSHIGGRACRGLAAELRRQAFFALKRGQQQIGGLVCQRILFQPLQHDPEQHIIHATGFYP